MGYSSVAMNQYMGNPVKAADLFNGTIFDGQHIVEPEDLEPWKGASEEVVHDKDDDKKIVQRYRDVIFKWKEGPLLALFAVENQSYVNYQMPLRNMLYDALTYEEQARNKWSQGDNSKTTPEEWRSKYQKEWKLTPLITLVFYYDSNDWDASKDLYDMLDFGEDEETKKIVQKYVANYSINLIDAKTAQKEKFQTDLQQVIGLVQCKGDKEEMERYIKENEDIFKNLEEDTYDAMGAILGNEKYFEKKKIVDEKGRVDMCPALQGFYDEGAMRKLKEIVSKKLQKGLTAEAIADFLEESLEVITDLVKEIQEGN